MLQRAKGSLFLLFIAIALLLYARSWTNYFVADDYDQCLDRIGFRRAISYFTKSWVYGNDYRPLLPFSYALDAAISKQSPIGFHVTNTLLHIANAILVGVISIAFAAPRPVGMLASILFLLNPVVHEAVLWISGRPVVLSTFFILMSLWMFSKFATGSRRPWLLASLTFFILGLLTYEGTVVVPLLLGVLIASKSPIERRGLWRVLTLYFFILAIYVVFWNVLYGGRVSRFPTESSLSGGTTSLWALIKRTFHGGSRGVAAAAYLTLSVLFARTKQGRRIWTTLLILMVTAYLPFFIVHGYADRFAYVASTAAAVLLAWMVLSLAQERFRNIVVIVLAAVLPVCYGYGIQKRITAWKEAGEIAREIPLGIKRLRPELPSNAVVFVNGVPDMHKDAYVYITGLESALRRLYPSVPLTVVKNVNNTLRTRGQTNTFFFQYSNGSVMEVYN